MLVIGMSWYNNHFGFSKKEELPNISNSSKNQPELSVPLIFDELHKSEDDLQKSQYSVEFSSKTENYCIGLVDMVDSTKISARIGWARTARYYEIFLNSMSEILKKFGGLVIKNVGDCLLYYFPESSKPERKFGFMSCLECSLTMIENREYLCEFLSKEGLPPVDYRVSADYGSVIIMKSNGTSMLDMIGPPVNMCSKINHFAKKNEIVIGGDLFQIAKNFDDYSFKGVHDFSIGFKYSYPVYSLRRRR